MEGMPLWSCVSYNPLADCNTSYQICGGTLSFVFRAHKEKREKSWRCAPLAHITYMNGDILHMPERRLVWSSRSDPSCSSQFMSYVSTPLQKSFREGSELCASNVVTWISWCSTYTFPSTLEVLQKKHTYKNYGCGPTTSCHRCPTGAYPFCSWTRMLELETAQLRLALVHVNLLPKTTTGSRCGHLCTNTIWQQSTLSTCLETLSMGSLATAQGLTMFVFRVPCYHEWIDVKFFSLPVNVFSAYPWRASEIICRCKWFSPIGTLSTRRGSPLHGIALHWLKGSWPDCIVQSLLLHVRPVWRAIVLSPSRASLQMSCGRSLIRLWLMQGERFTNNIQNITWILMIPSRLMNIWFNVAVILYPCHNQLDFNTCCGIHSRILKCLQCYDNGLHWSNFGRHVLSWTTLLSEINSTETAHWYMISSTFGHGEIFPTCGPLHACCHRGQLAPKKEFTINQYPYDLHFLIGMCTWLNQVRTVDGWQPKFRDSLHVTVIDLHVMYGMWLSRPTRISMVFCGLFTRRNCVRHALIGPPPRKCGDSYCIQNIIAQLCEVESVCRIST